MANTKKQVLHVEVIETGKKMIINKEDFNPEIHKQVRVDIAVPEKTDSDNKNGTDGTVDTGDNNGVTNAEGQKQEEEKTEEGTET